MHNSFSGALLFALLSVSSSFGRGYAFAQAANVEPSFRASKTSQNKKRLNVRRGKGGSVRKAKTPRKSR